MKLEVKKKDPSKILQDKVENIMREGKWLDNKVPVFLNLAHNIPRAFGRRKDHKDLPSMRHS